MIEVLSDRMTTPEAARYTGLSESFLEKRRLRSDGPAYIKAGAKVLYERSSLDVWLGAQTRRSTSEYQTAGAAA